MRLPFAACLAVLLFLVPSASATVLYDGGTNALPNSATWRWLYLTDGVSTPSISGGATTLNTTAGTSESAGFFAHVAGTTIPDGFPIELPVTPILPTLDRTAGYTIRFQTKLTAETHNNDDRAGLSIIVLGSDKLGIELGLWTNEIWAQSDNLTGPGYFKHAEGTAHDTSSLQTYDLAILGNSYRLFSGTTQILSGVLRDYSASGIGVDTSSVHVPIYDTANFLFLGDDTSSASANFDLAHVEYLSFAVPEPSSGVLAILGAACLWGVQDLRRRRS